MIRHYKILITLFLVLITAVSLTAQCPMCRIAAESNLENGGSAGAGLNTGILYMLSMPYLIVAALGFIWYRNRKTDKENLEDSLKVPSAN